MVTQDDENMQFSLNRYVYIVNLVRGVLITFVRKLVGRDKFKRRKYNGNRILENNQANDILRTLIEKGEPFLVARFGDVELRTTLYYIERKLGFRKTYPEKIRTVLSRNAGFFPTTDEYIDRFGSIMLKSCSQVDVLAVWFNLLEEYVSGKFRSTNNTCVYLDALEPFWFENPWSNALAGKRVLVIHPFAETIQKQYTQRAFLFENQDVLPTFELITLKAVQSIGGNSDQFDNWFDALDYMYLQAMDKNFDIAIVGCGAYGMPLSARIKNKGKMVIHMGGVTQFLFGIKGKRWDNRPKYAHLYNESWSRPSDDEKPQTASQVENGCYW